MTRRSTLLLVTVDYPPMEGGISSLCAGVSRSLSGLGEQVVVLGPKLKKTSFKSEERGVTVYRSPLYWASFLRIFPILVIFPFLVLIHRTRWIISLNIGYGGVVSYLYHRLLGFDFLVYAYGFEFLKYKHNWAIRALYLRIYSSAFRVIAISRFVQEQLISFGVDKSKIVLINPGVDPSSLEDPGIEKRTFFRKRFGLEGKKIVLCVARFVSRKGHGKLLKVFQDLLQDIPESRLVLVGRGRMLESIRKEAGRLGLSGHIVFTGFMGQDDLTALYHEAEVFVMLPRDSLDLKDAEGFGIVFLEAACCALPCVATRSGGVTEAVVDGETGLLFDQDDMTRIAGGLKSLLTDRTLASKLGKAGRRRVLDSLTWRNAAQQIKSLME